ncbi:glycoside hydrolase family 97 C-terminal domain-containing protein [Micromonospora sp. M12]
MFSPYNRDTTPAHELATSIVFESGWQHLGDNPESYEARPEALHILNQIPTTWDETRLLGGRPGQDAYFARRNGGRWYLGGISAQSARTYSTPLTFSGRSVAGGDRPRRVQLGAGPRDQGRHQHRQPVRGDAGARRLRLRRLPLHHGPDHLRIRHRHGPAGQASGGASTCPSTARPTGPVSNSSTATAVPTRRGRRRRRGS